MKMPHTRCCRNKRVRVRLRDGTIIDDRFHERAARWIVLVHHGKIMKNQIKAFILLKDVDQPRTIGRPERTRPEGE